MSSTMLKYRPATEIRYDEYRMNPGSFHGIMNTHWKENESWIMEDGTRLGFVWVIVCGMEIVKGGYSLAHFPDQDALDEVGKRYNLIPFAYVLNSAPSD